MEPRKTYQDVTIGERVFRMKMLDARTGSWLWSLLTSKASPNGDPISMAQLITAFGLLDQPTFTSIQDQLLKRVYVLEQRDNAQFESAIVAPNGQGFSFPFLSEDPKLIFDLTQMGVLMNVAPFFPEKQSSSKPSNQADSIPANTPTSTQS